MSRARGLACYSAVNNSEAPPGLSANGRGAALHCDEGLNMAIDIEPGAATFRSRLIGFDKDEVRACLQNLAGDYAESQKQVERLTLKLKALEEAQGQTPVRDSVGVQVERVLASAHKVAEDVKNEANETARKILSDAQEEAARLRSQAENDASALTKTAAARLTELNTEIDRVLERRDALHAQLHRAAGQLEDLSRGIRATVPAPEASPTGWLKPQIVAKA